MKLTIVFNDGSTREIVDIHSVDIELDDMNTVHLLEIDSGTLQVNNAGYSGCSKADIALLGMMLELVDHQTINLIPEG